MRSCSLVFGIIATCLLALASARHHRSVVDKFVDKESEEPPHVEDHHVKRLEESQEDDLLISETTRKIIPIPVPFKKFGHKFVVTTEKPTRRQKKKVYKRRNKKNRKQKKNQRRSKNATFVREGRNKIYRLESDNDLQKQLDSFGPRNQELLIMAQQHAMKVIVEKMIIAFGPEFIEEKHKVPKNLELLSIPTVASPLNITTEHCPSIYAKCSSEIFYTSCDPSPGSNRSLWDLRFNFYFDLPDDLLKNTDELLNGTIRIYKSKKLPLTTPVEITVFIHAYTAGFTEKKDWNILINSIQLASDYVGWVTLDVSTWARQSHNSDKNFGFFIKIRDSQGIHWPNAAEFFQQRNCSEGSQELDFMPVPFGVETNEPKVKFPSLTIHTGMLDHHYSNRAEDNEDYLYEDDNEESLDEYEDDFYETDSDEELIDEDQMFTSSLSTETPYSLSDEYGDKEMPRDDPKALKNGDSSNKDQQIENDDIDESELEEQPIFIHQVQRYVLPHNVLIQNPQPGHLRGMQPRQEQAPNIDRHDLSSSEEEEEENDDGVMLSRHQYSIDNYQQRIVSPKHVLTPLSLVMQRTEPTPTLKKIQQLHKKSSSQKASDGQRRRARLLKKKRNIKHRHNHQGKESRRRRNNRH